MKVAFYTQPFQREYPYKPIINKDKCNLSRQNACQNKTSSEFKIPFEWYRNNLITFKGAQCAQDNFAIRQIEGLSCPCCGIPMVTNREILSISNQVSTLRGEEFQEEFSKCFKYFKPFEKEIAEDLLNLSKEKPEKNIEELVDDKAKTSIKPLQESQLTVIEEIKEAVKNKDLERCKKQEIFDFLGESEEKIGKIDEILTNEENDKHFKRKNFIKQFRIWLNESEGSENEEFFNNLLNTSCKMPNSTNNKHAFYVKHSRRSGQEIAAKLLRSSCSTTEHIKPQSNRGENNTGNYIPLCADCNSKRGNTPYNVWLQEHPAMRENLQKYLYIANNLIQNGKFDDYEGYDTYVDDIIEAFKRESNGELILKKPKKTSKRKKKDEIKQTIEEPIRLSPEDLVYCTTSEIRQIKEEKIKYDQMLQKTIKQKAKMEEVLQSLKKAESALEEAKTSGEENKINEAKANYAELSRQYNSVSRAYTKRCTALLAQRQIITDMINKIKNTESSI